MLVGKIEVKRRVWIGLGFALGVTAGWWSWTRAKPPVGAGARPATQQPFVHLAGAGAADQILREQAELMDPTPLFFPTEWNYGQHPLSEKMRRQPSQVFASFPPNVDFGEKGIKAYGVEAVAVPGRLADVVAQGNEAPFAGMGQIDVPHAALEERGSFVEIRDLVLNKTIIAKTLRGIKLPQTDFAPLEFLAVVSSAGLVGDPVLVQGSGWEEVDGFFRSYLVKTFRLGERLNPGRYRVLVGP